MVHGDVFNGDTRSVLQILEIGEVDFCFKEASSNTIEAALKPVAQSDDPLKDFMNIAQTVPVLEDQGKKNLGSGQQMIMYVCLKDSRNGPKRDSKTGKLIKKKKGPPAKNLYDKELQPEVNLYLEWFLGKFRPVVQHFTNAVVKACNYEKKAKNPDSKQIDEYGMIIQNDVEMMKPLLRSMNSKMEKNGNQYLASKTHISMMDIMVYNELSQFLNLYHHYMISRKASQDKYFEQKVDSKQTDMLNDYPVIKAWFTTTMESDPVISKIVKKYDLLARELINDKIAAFKDPIKK